eukprot:gene9790-11437_t
MQGACLFGLCTRPQHTWTRRHTVDDQENTDRVKEAAEQAIKPQREKSEAAIKTHLAHIDALTAYTYNNCQHVIGSDTASFSTFTSDELQELLSKYPLFEQLLDVPKHSPDTAAVQTNYTFAELAQHMAKINEPFTLSTGMIEYIFNRDDKISESFVKDVTDMFSIECIDVMSKVEESAANPLEFADIYLISHETRVYSPASGNARHISSVYPQGCSFDANNACVNTGSHIYQFCLAYDYNLVQRIDTTTQEGQIVEVNNLGRNHISACYDGSRYIYLLGGGTVDKVDRFDTTNSAVETFGQMPTAANNLYSHYCQDSQSIFYWCGYDYDGLLTHSVHRFNVADRSSQQLFTINFTMSELVGSCYDHQEFFYFLTQQYLFKVSKNGKGEAIFLAPPPTDSTPDGSLIYTHVQGIPKILIFNSSHLLIYDVQLNQWKSESPNLYSEYSMAVGGVVGWRNLKKIIV